MFKKNIGALDRTIRTLIGLGIIGAGFYYHSWWGLIGIIPLFTVATSSCYLYTLLGISTCTVKKPATPPQQNTPQA